MIVIEVDETRPVGIGRFHVRLIDAESGEFGSASHRQNQVGYWCDIAHLVSGLLAPLLAHVSDDDLERVRRYARPQMGAGAAEAAS
ncbi:MAG: hypothetical protein KGL39_04255 [Patescibacteria group bacterium]|nr:hypothetical protein [Patescibacteria group bacterium]